jgi:hypothetical protein
VGGGARRTDEEEEFFALVQTVAVRAMLIRRRWRRGEDRDDRGDNCDGMIRCRGVRMTLLLRISAACCSNGWDAWLCLGRSCVDVGRGNRATCCNFRSKPIVGVGSGTAAVCLRCLSPKVASTFRHSRIVNGFVGPPRSSSGNLGVSVCGFRSRSSSRRRPSRSRVRLRHRRRRHWGQLRRPKLCRSPARSHAKLFRM